MYNRYMRIEHDGRTPEDVLERFEATVLHIDKVWSKILLEQRGLPYNPPRVVLFQNDVNTACGQGLTSFGPFYCSGDWSVYLDVRWFERLRNEYGADPGIFSEMYIIAHEIGHQIQAQLGEFHRILSAPGDSSIRVRGELIADAYAGLWAGQAKKDPEFPWKITKKDIDNALSAAKAVGDDTIQLRRSGEVSTEKFGHGSAAQREAAFKLGLKGATLSQINQIWFVEDLNAYLGI